MYFSKLSSAGGPRKPLSSLEFRGEGYSYGGNKGRDEVDRITIVADTSIGVADANKAPRESTAEAAALFGEPTVQHRFP